MLLTANLKLHPGLLQPLTGFMTISRLQRESLLTVSNSRRFLEGTLSFQRSGRRLNGKERIRITDHGIIDNIKKTVLLNINNIT